MPLDARELDRLTRAYGEELFARIDTRGPLPLSPTWFDDRLMEWSMANEAVKIQLFRFIDALPLLRNPADISRHLREYFGEARLSPLMHRLVGCLPRAGVGAKFLAWNAHRNSARLARKFIAGTNLDEALATIARLRQRKLAFTVDLLGEASIAENEADRYQGEYLRLVEGLARTVNAWPKVDLIDRDPYGDLARVNVSVKLSSLYSQFDPIDPDGTMAIVKDRLRSIFRLARQHAVFVNFDMEQHAYKDLTCRIFRELCDEPEFRDWTDVGIAIQAYLRDTEKDVHALADWARRRGTPVWVRLIKGAYWDYETVIAAQENWPVPVFTQKAETDATYERLAEFLLENHRVLRPAFGSHNLRSVAHTMAAAQMLGLPPTSYEIQMLYGMADPVKDALVRLGQRVRVYTPFGQLLPGMAYLVRRLLENTANTSFLRASFTEHVPEEKLLMNPALLLDETPPPTVDRHGFRNEPLTDFSTEAGRRQMQEALADVKKQLGRDYPALVDGKPLEAPAWIETANPSHLREIVGRFPKTSADQAKTAIAAASRAFPMWRDREPSERSTALRKIAASIRERRFELAAWQVYECAKPWREADADIAEAIDFCEYYAQEADRLFTPRNVNVPGEQNANLYEPRGVTIVIAPWNFPLAILCGMTTAALVTGNPVILKPAEQSSIIAAKFMEILQAHLPAGVAGFLPGIGEEIGPTLAEHPETALVAFTGSRGVGMILSRQTAELAQGQTHLKRLIAELGGKNAILVDDDADLDEAVLGTVTSAFGYAGQKCSACSRVVVLEAIYDVFLNRLIEATKSLKLAPAEDPGCRVGPVIDADAQKRVLAAIDKGKDTARLAYAGDLGFLRNEGHYVAPHIFAEVPPTSPLAQEEIFGPVLAVLKAKNLDEALSIANGTSYALTGGIFSRSPANIARVKRHFRVGNLYVNRKITGALVDRQPFGGYKLSGIGSKAGGPDYLLQFVWPRCITENTMRRGFAPGQE
ncbi:MAG TPA: L-glutamate gamma-semialdehyde dehydrogenase [Gemmataceae bacterium]|jgi:RHH-type proline utilization regulon transcriptional repressor/proline dehydrogenase/delta 1-pyrroline-5-carboxylate dehydrogenase|nr:L-glutamate gamma-semialdehyde dehydrogenase [Gemmataceae bacterium]